MNIALIEPEIPQNTGNIGRLSVATNTTLILVGELGFQLDNKNLKRAGLDYWENLNLKRFLSTDDFWEFVADKDFAIFSKKVDKCYTEYSYNEDSILIFGRETMGIPEDILAKYKEKTYKIPMWGQVRSLNLSNSVSIVLYEGYRQLNFLNYTC